jgi:hypothetical protein
MALSLAGPHSGDPFGALSSAAGEALELRLEAAGRPMPTFDAGGELMAVAPNWKASFSEAGARFTPALGSRVEQNHSLEMALRGVRVGGVSIGALPSDGYRAEGSTATRASASMDESWSAREDGLELWLTLDHLPRRGELVVDYAVSGDLGVVTHDGSGVTYTLPGVGGVRLDGVVGIDADGRQAEGAIRTGADGLQFVSLNQSTREADLAIWEEGEQALWVFEVQYSETDTDVYAWRRDLDGAPIGPLIPIAVTVENESHPTVGCNSVTGEYIVAWNYKNESSPETGQKIWGCTVGVDTGALTTLPVFLSPLGAPFSDGPFKPLLTNQSSSGSEDDALLLGFHSDLGDCGYVPVSKSSDGQLTVALGKYKTLSTTGVSLSVSKDGGDTGRHLFTWIENTAADDHFAGMLVDDGGTELHFSPDLEGFGLDIQELDRATVTGDGEDFYLVYFHDLVSLFGNPIEDRLERQHLRVGDFGLERISRDILPKGDKLLQVDPVPVAAIVGNQLLVSWPTVGSLQCLAVDLETSTVCTAIEEAGAGGLDFYPAVASTGTRALLTWTTLDFMSFQEQVMIQGFEALSDDSQYVDYGGGGTYGGKVQVPCAFVGNADFEVRLSEAVYSESSWLILGRDTFYLPCADMKLLVDPFTSVLLPGTWESVSDEWFVKLPVPTTLGLTGQSFLVQWFVAGEDVPGACPVYGGVFSNAVRFNF